MGTVDRKLVLLGNKNVGKTCIFNRYIYDRFGRTSMTIGAYFGMKECKADGRTVSVALWDTAGEERFDSLTNFYCRGSRGAVLCYDLTLKSTFDGLGHWVDKVKREADEKCAIILVGTKLDLVNENPELRQVTWEEADQYAKSIGADHIEASAKDGTNVNKLFEMVVLSCFIKGGEIPDPNDPGVDIAATESGGCC